MPIEPLLLGLPVIDSVEFERRANELIKHDKNLNNLFTEGKTWRELHQRAKHYLFHTLKCKPESVLWWEGKNRWQIPRYVKDIRGGRYQGIVYEVVKKLFLLDHLENPDFFIFTKYGRGYWQSFFNVVPATEEEYNNYINELNTKIKCSQTKNSHTQDLRSSWTTPVLNSM